MNAKESKAILWHIRIPLGLVLAASSSLSASALDNGQKQWTSWVPYTLDSVQHAFRIYYQYYPHPEQGGPDWPVTTNAGTKVDYIRLLEVEDKKYVSGDWVKDLELSGYDFSQPHKLVVRYKLETNFFPYLSSSNRVGDSESAATNCFSYALGETVYWIGQVEPFVTDDFEEAGPLDGELVTHGSEPDNDYPHASSPDTFLFVKGKYGEAAVYRTLYYIPDLIFSTYDNYYWKEKD